MRDNFPPRRLICQVFCESRRTWQQPVQPAKNFSLEGNQTPARYAHSLSLDGPHRKPGDKAIEEEVVDKRHRQTCNQASCHERAPEVDIAAHKKNRDSHADHLLRLGCDEGKSVNIFLGYKSKGEDHYSKNAGKRDGHHHLDERTKAREAIDHGGVLEFPGDRFEEAHQQPDGKRHGNAGVNQYQRPYLVLQPENGHYPRKRYEEQRRRHQVG